MEKVKATKTSKNQRAAEEERVSLAGQAASVRAQKPLPTETPALRPVSLGPSNPSLVDRRRRGRLARSKIPFSEHAGFKPARNRPDPISILELQAQTRVPELIPIRHGRMLSSPFAFYRGAAAIMAADLHKYRSPDLPFVQACGDAHLNNFGLYQSPERRLVFDINDFDETLPGPWEWDVKRLAASIEVAGRANGFDSEQRGEIVMASARGYRQAMAEFAEMGNLAVWYSHTDIEAFINKLVALGEKKQLKKAQRLAKKAVGRNSQQAFDKLTTMVHGVPQFVTDPPLMVPLRDLAIEKETEVDVSEMVETLLRGYIGTLSEHRRGLMEQFELVDVALKVVGVGSVGTSNWVALFQGHDPKDPFVLQVKEAQPSVMEPYVGRSKYENHGRRVVVGQRLMQAYSDIFLGWQQSDGIDGVPRDFYVRQFRDGKASLDVEVMTVGSLGVYAQLCGWTLARAHAGTGDRVAMAAYLGETNEFDQAMATFAVAYADQNERDFEALAKAAKSGRVETIMGI